MPELPDLVHIAARLDGELRGHRVDAVRVREPIVLRMLTGGDLGGRIGGRTFRGVSRHGPFLRFSTDGPLVIAHLMLAGRFRLDGRPRPVARECFALELDDGRVLRYGDERKMGRIYVTDADTTPIPGYDSQGVDPTGPEFTAERFAGMVHDRRNQVRVLLMDQTLISAIGNAYADEILFAAGIHPKTRCHDLGSEEVTRLYGAIRETLAWGTAEVAAAGRPIEVKVRDHMRVRGRRGEPCPACGVPIRRAGVLGYDAFFCPRCQSIPWGHRPQ